MKILITLLGLLGLLTVQATEIDFSKAYFLDSVETEETDTPLVLNIAGVQTTQQTNKEEITLDWILSLGFNPDDATFHLLDSIPQKHFDVQLEQQRLRGTNWEGEYKTSSNLYETELYIKAVQAGFVGAEVVHYTLDDPEPSNFLRAKLIGDINSQYLIDKDQEGELDWVDVDEYEDIVEDINEKEESEANPIPEILSIRHLMRLKRGQRIGDSEHATSSWGTFNEYRLTLEDGKITGNVGKPPEKYGSKDALTGNGKIELIQPETQQVLE
ncbi:hypothetical protein QUF74_17010 [Candidatus Halobeggiatoa sp. HSG11]|nr:hypothetical protein [Candidatus Halobeggiatoa sp. HSG11]